MNAYQGFGRGWIGLIAALGVVLAVAAPCPGQCQYEVMIIQAEECPPYGYPPTKGLGLNESGHVVGSYPFCVIGFDVPFLWTPETGMIDLSLPPDSYEARVEDINQNEQMVGLMIHNDYGHRAFMYDNGEYTVLPPVIPDSGWSYAMAINSHGQVVGYRSIGEDVNPYNAYIWSPHDGFTDLGVMEGPYSSATDISDTGIVVGWTGRLGLGQAFLWQDGDLVLLGPIPEGTTSHANAVNNRREVVGSGAMLPDHPSGLLGQPVLWKDGQWHLLGVLPGCDVGGARDINDLTQIVGHCTEPDNTWRAFLWQNGSMYDLNELTMLERGFTIRRAKAINNGGQIIADGHDTGDSVVTFVLTPMNRPTGDIDCDCDVDVSDLLFLLGEWGKTNSPADINGDGIVNVFDLLALLADWGS